ncbi:hypothetical protein [Nonlabens xiamenensis]|uniref:hypothetical protein n=1 Tax=Nonlabens xiamenensis TaxID=2341043 RepID=UPI000F610591|nr:hypothetical protein [Nonlabens xiamenensis]
MKFYRSTLICTGITFMVGLPTIAQTGPGFVDDVADAPIPGIALAIAAAIGIGCYKLRKRN